MWSSTECVGSENAGTGETSRVDWSRPTQDQRTPPLHLPRSKRGFVHSLSEIGRMGSPLLLLFLHVGHAPSEGHRRGFHDGQSSAVEHEVRGEVAHRTASHSGTSRERGKGEGTGAHEGSRQLQTKTFSGIYHFFLFPFFVPF